MSVYCFTSCVILVKQGDCFVVATETSVQRWTICRDVNYEELKGHTEPLISLVSIEVGSM